jgi:uncharacterized membrane protein
LKLSKGSSEPVREANTNSRAFKLAVLLLFVTFLTPLSSAKSYTLEEATANITIDPNGVAHVKEAISYTFDGNYRSVYRMINTSTGESVRNIEGYCSGNACEFRVERIPEGYRLIGDLPESTPENLTFFVFYDHCGAVKVHNDISEFHKRWGEEWERPLGSLKGSITFPVKNGSEIQYWTHPAGYTQEENTEQNILNFKTKEIPASYWYEIRAVFPRIESPNSSFVQVDNADKLEEILATEKEYHQKELSLENLYKITVYFLLFVLAFPIFIYLRYGRELKTDNEEEIDYEERTDNEEEVDYKEKINYGEKYKRELPVDPKPAVGNKPAVVNAIMKGRMGIPTIDGFTATFMDLANRGYISLRDIEPGETDSAHTPDSETQDFIIELNHDIYSKVKGNPSELEDFEEDVLNMLKDLASERKISWREFKKEIEGGKDFYQFITSWSKKVQAHTEIDRFFQSTGSTFMNWFSRGVLVAAVVYYIAVSGDFPSDKFPQVSKINTLIALSGLWGFIMMKNSEMFIKIFDCWTPEGNLYYESWDNFKEYITDLSSLKERLPESIKTWDSYLVYAASLGIVRQALQNMSLIIPFEQTKESRFCPIINFYYSQSGYESGNVCSFSGQDEEKNREGNKISSGFGGGGGGAE